MSAKSNSRELISFDWALKRLLRNKANFVILEGFLSELLQFDIVVQNILESESNKQEEDDKINRVDLLCENQFKELLLIEVQYFSELDYFQRMLFGASKLITEYLKEGDLYSEVRKVYSINILYFDLGQGADYIYKGRTIFKGLHSNDELRLSINQKARFKKEVPADLYPEYFILKINTFDRVAKSSLDEWIYYLKNGELPQPYQAKGLKEVEKKLKVEKMEPTAKKQYQKYVEDMRISRSALETARYEGRAEGELKGAEKGRLEEKRQIVINSFEQGLSLELISSITSLSVEEVENILKEA